jgi:predicted dehydrogenase
VTAVEVYRAGDRQEISQPLPEALYSWCYRREAEHFVKCLQTGEEFRSSGADTLTDVRLFEEVFHLWSKDRA